MSDTRPRFHLAIPVHDLEAARAFYGECLGCPEGRSDVDWIDFDLAGHQLVVHRVAAVTPSKRDHNAVDGHAVPVPHFGLVLDPAAFHTMADRLRAAAVPFEIEPYVRFEGQPGEQWTMFVYDPSGNALEFKAFGDIEQLFRP